MGRQSRNTKKSDESAAAYRADLAAISAQIEAERAAAANLTNAKRAAADAYLAAIVLEPCPLGPGENDAFAWDEAFGAALDAGESMEGASAIAHALNECGGYPKDAWFTA